MHFLFFVVVFFLKSGMSPLRRLPFHFDSIDSRVPSLSFARCNTEVRLRLSASSNQSVAAGSISTQKLSQVLKSSKLPLRPNTDQSIGTCSISNVFGVDSKSAEGGELSEPELRHEDVNVDDVLTRVTLDRQVAHGQFEYRRQRASQRLHLPDDTSNRQKQMSRLNIPT